MIHYWFIMIITILNLRFFFEFVYKVLIFHKKNVKKRMKSENQILVRCKQPIKM